MRFSYIAATVVALALPAWTALGASVQLRMTHAKPGPDLDQLEIVHSDSAAALKELVFVDRTTLLDQRNVRSAQVETAADGSPRIELMLNEPDNNLEHALHHGAGHRLAIVVDGKAVGTGEIVRPFQGNQVELEGDFTKSEAQQIVNQINQSRPKL